MPEAPVLDAPVSTGLNPPPPAGSAKEAMFGGLNKLAREPDVKNTPAPVKKVEPPKPEAKAPEKKEAEAKAPENKETPEVKDEVKDTPEPPKADVPSKPKKPSDFLREELAKIKAERDTFRTEVEKLKAPKEDPEKKTLTEKLAAEEKRRKEIEDELRFTNYERSAEFKEKYVQPYNDAYAEAIADVDQMTVPVDLNDPEGSARKATKDDLAQIVNLPPQQAGRLAKQLFGEGAQTMMNHRDALLRTWKAQQQALSEGRKMAEQREAELTARQSQQQAELKKLQSELRTSKESNFLERHPELVIGKDAKGEPVDLEAFKVLERDRSVTDNLFREDSKMSPEKKLELHAEMRNRAAHFGTVLHNYRKVSKELADVKQKLKEYEDSEPNPGEGKKDDVPPELAGAVGMTGMIQGLTKIAREKTGPPAR